MEKTRYRYLEQSDQNGGLPQPPLELPAAKGRRVIELPDPRTVKADPLDVREAIERRASVRAYSGEALSLGELSLLLWCTQGVKQVSGRPATLRTVPSAGARHCFETYVLANRVDGLHPGLYRFLAVDHKLQEVDLGPDVAERVTKACLDQRFILASAATFIWTAVAYRMMWRYGERGYRYMHLDAGHACQNLYLLAEAVGCGACAVAAFDDDLLNKALGVDGVDQFAVYVGVVGKKP
ncbi:nitroreductase [Candidatus Bathyarchaeota archaeon RBG_13_60_20]|nr:MAG: nitroreductase [Candidatus Bathyarchaeota archaeon RBG_13_60_20]